MSDRIRLLVVFGGESSEHEVSCMSAESVLNNIDEDKYEITKLGITKEGQWLLTEASSEVIGKDRWQEDPTTRKAILSPDRSDGGLLVFEDTGVRNIPVDCVWLGLHGTKGEDGSIQGLLELAGIPYLGPGVCASSCAMDKSVTKMLVAASDVKQADCFMLTRMQINNDLEDCADQVEAYFDEKYPFFIKPASEGSSTGITKAHDRKELMEALTLAASYFRKVLIEETIVGRELEVAVLGNDTPRVSRVGEILAGDEFYTYDDKYINGVSRTRIVDDLPQEKIEELRLAALTVYMLVDCRGLSRVDFFLKEDGTVIFNEINTLPGFTSISMYPKLWEDSGISYSQLIDELIGFAMER